MLHALRTALRSLRRQPGFSLVSILTLALGIGATTAVFTVVDAVVLSPPDFPRPQQLVMVSHTAPGIGVERLGMSTGTYFHYRAHNRTLEGFALWDWGFTNLTGDGEPQQVTTIRATESLMSVLGSRPARGRWFTAEEDAPGGPPVAVITHTLWQERWGSDPRALGDTLVVDGVEREVVGILPPTFDFPDPDVRLWLPLGLDPAEARTGGFSTNSMARMDPGVDPGQVQEDLNRLIRQLPEVYDDLSAEVLENARLATVVETLQDVEVGDVRATLWILLGTVGLVLLIACANVANLFLARAEARGREVAVRSALGASPGNLLRRYLGESLALALIAGILGLALAAAGIRLLLQLEPEGLPRLADIGIGLHSVAFAAGVSGISGVLFGLFPVLRLDRQGLAARLKEDGRSATTGRGRQRLRRALVVAQLALALVLTSGSALMVRSYSNLVELDPGFEAEGVLTVQVSLPRGEYEDAADTARFHQRALERFAALPGVESTGGARILPLVGGYSVDPVYVEGQPVPEGELPPVVDMNYVAPGYFETLGIERIAGRTFVTADHENPTGTALVSRSLAERFWPGDSAVGKRVKLDPDTDRWLTVVGVVGSVRSRNLMEEPPQTIYFPMVGPEGSWWSTHNFTYVLKASGDPDSLIRPVREVVRSLDADVPLAYVRTLERLVADDTAQVSFSLLLIGLAAGIALLLGAVGLYAVFSWVVTQRRAEIGVRMALGADRGRITRLVLSQAAVLVALGTGLGLAGSLAVTRLLDSLLFQVSAGDPFLLAAVVTVLALVSLLASLLPARRASRQDPLEALREG